MTMKDKNFLFFCNLHWLTGHSQSSIDCYSATAYTPHISNNNNNNNNNNNKELYLFIIFLSSLDPLSSPVHSLTFPFWYNTRGRSSETLPLSPVQQTHFLLSHCRLCVCVCVHMNNNNDNNNNNNNKRCRLHFLNYFSEFFGLHLPINKGSV